MIIILWSSIISFRYIMEVRSFWRIFLEFCHHLLSQLSSLSASYSGALLTGVWCWAWADICEHPGPFPTWQVHTDWWAGGRNSPCFEAGPGCTSGSAQVLDLFGRCIWAPQRISEPQDSWNVIKWCLNGYFNRYIFGGTLLDYRTPKIFLYRWNCIPNKNWEALDRIAIINHSGRQ